MLWTPADPEKLSLHNDVLSASSPQKSRQAGRTHTSKWQYLKSMAFAPSPREASMLCGTFARSLFFVSAGSSQAQLSAWVFVNMFSLPG